MGQQKFHDEHQPSSNNKSCFIPVTILFLAFVAAPVVVISCYGVGPLAHNPLHNPWTLRNVFFTWLRTVVSASIATVGINGFVSWAFGELQYLAWKDVKPDIELTMHSVLKLSPVFTLMHIPLWEGTAGSVYSDPHKYSMWWSFGLGPIVALIVSDSFFYW